MRLIEFVLLVFCLLTSCNSKEKNATAFPMSEDKIIDVLIDMHYAGEASRITRNINHDSLQNVYTNQVLEIHKIDSTQLESLMNYLQKDLETFYKIEQKVHLKIKELKDKK